MNQIKYDINETNEFKANSSLFNLNETSLFGSIKFKQYSNTNLFKSRILKDEQQCLELINLCEFSPKDKWTLLYRGIRDGFVSNDFHSKCDGHSNTLTILKAKQSSYVFGGFTAVDWESPAEGKWKSDPNAFVFSLTNKANKPVKKKYDTFLYHFSIYCHSGCGPIFGWDNDIHIANNANTTMGSHCKLEIVHKQHKSILGMNETKTHSAQPVNFQLDEIEVYQKRLN
jgi:hypothetical protein